MCTYWEMITSLVNIYDVGLHLSLPRDLDGAAQPVCVTFTLGLMQTLKFMTPLHNLLIFHSPLGDEILPPSSQFSNSKPRNLSLSFISYSITHTSFTILPVKCFLILTILLISTATVLIQATIHICQSGTVMF